MSQHFGHFKAARRLGRLKAAQSTGTINGFVGLLAHRTKKIATIEEINEAIAQAWAGKA